MSALGFQDHDHHHCIEAGLRAAERVCASAGLKLTPQRRRVLEILLSEHRAMGAYDILEVLKAEGHTAQPPVAYRALDFLVAHGFAHKVERLNAFIACAHPGCDHAPAFLICRMCKSVAETPSDYARAALAEAPGADGFVVEASSIEAVGVCPACQKDAPCP
ncbi:MAG: Fur family transcriptional regulator [Paracoccaceae bacterium]